MKHLMQKAIRVCDKYLLNNGEFFSLFVSGSQGIITSKRNDSDMFQDFFDALISKISTKISLITHVIASKKRVLRIAVNIDDANRKVVAKTFKEKIPAIKSLRARSDIRMFVRENVRTIRSIPEKLLSKVEQAVHDSYKNGDSSTSLADSIKEIYAVTDRQAELIARDQTQKLNMSLTKARHLEHGRKYYKWSTSGDERVRKSHEVMNNKICLWLDSTVYKDNIKDARWKKRASIGGTLKDIGQDIQCRCTTLITDQE